MRETSVVMICSNRNLPKLARATNEPAVLLKPVSNEDLPAATE